MAYETKDHIRAAAISALQDKNDECATQLFRCLSLIEAQAKEPATPAQPVQLEVQAVDTSDVISPKAKRIKIRGLHTWTRIIEMQYLQYLKTKDQIVFTAQDFFGWAEHIGIVLSEAELKPYSGGTRPRWRQMVSKALDLLKKRKVIYHYGYNSGHYSTVPIPDEELTNHHPIKKFP